MNGRSDAGEHDAEHDAAPGSAARADERSGLLDPERLSRYGARRFPADSSIADVVDHFWAVDWRLEEGERVRQRIIASPQVHLTVERGDVPARLVVTGVYRATWFRDLAGHGGAFGIILRPAGLRVLSDLPVRQLADATVPLTPQLDPRLHAMLDAVAGEATTEARVEATTRLIRRAQTDRAPTSSELLANRAVRALDRSPSLTGAQLAAQVGVTERSIQRALRETIGLGPKWVRRSARLQEVVRSLSVHPRPPVADIAARLGYADQSHLINDFRDAVGMTPGEYLQSLSVAATGA